VPFWELLELSGGPTRMTRLIVMVVVTLALGACGGGETTSSEGSGSCALVVEYEGESYDAFPVEVAPPEGDPVGTGILPPCNDTNDADEEAEEIELARFPGASPHTALVWPGRHDIVLIAEGTDQLPQGVAALQSAPGCDADETPIRLFGEWWGILGADGNTEDDLIPPYDLEVVVRDATPEIYERADLFVRVPRSLGKPLTHDDVKSSLWEGGDIEILVDCEDGRFIAERVEAFAPD
jgi:hypothetical protein